MSSKVTSSAVIAASPDAVRSAILDVENYPNWQREMKHVSILTSDAEGRPKTVKFDVSVMGQSAGYTLEFSYPADNVISSHLTEGDMMVKQDQTYTLVEVSGGTQVEYSLDIAIKWQVPDFMLKSIINKGVKTNLTGIKKTAEAA